MHVRDRPVADLALGVTGAVVGVLAGIVVHNMALNLLTLAVARWASRRPDRRSPASKGLWAEEHHYTGSRFERLPLTATERFLRRGGRVCVPGATFVSRRHIHSSRYRRASTRIGRHPRVHAAPAALDSAAVTWALLRGLDDASNAAGDTDLLVAASDAPRPDAILGAVGFARLPPAVTPVTVSTSPMIPMRPRGRPWTS